MFQKMKIIVISLVISLSFLGCTLSDASGTSKKDEEMITAFVIGSAEYPDPVLERVRELEKAGLINNVVVRESFPVQIDVTGPKSVIDKLKAMPRKESPSFK